MPSFWPKPLFGQEKMIGVMGRRLTSQTVTSIVGRIFGHSWPSFSKWSTHHRSDSSSLNLCRTKNLSGRRRLRSTVFSTTRSMTPRPGHLEAIFNLEYDIMSDTTKSRRFGFHEWVDTEEMLFRLFTQFQKMRFIPV